MREFQAHVATWVVECFGQTAASDLVERNWRFLEESLELVQSLGGNAEDAHKLVAYVFGREVGDPEQEIGGTMTCLAALCAAAGVDLADASYRELHRIRTPGMIDTIRAKRALKPDKSSSAGDY